MISDITGRESPDYRRRPIDRTWHFNVWDLYCHGKSQTGFKK